MAWDAKNRSTWSNFQKTITMADFSLRNIEKKCIEFHVMLPYQDWVSLGKVIWQRVQNIAPSDSKFPHLIEK